MSNRRIICVIEWLCAYGGEGVPVRKMKRGIKYPKGKGMLPTRNDEVACYSASACEIVAEAADMKYKNVERIWNERTKHASPGYMHLESLITEHLLSKSPEPNEHTQMLILLFAVKDLLRMDQQETLS